MAGKWFVYLKREMNHRRGWQSALVAARKPRGSTQGCTAIASVATAQGGARWYASTVQAVLAAAERESAAYR